MKKVLLGVLLIVPIIIVAAVVLTTQFISSTVYLPVDSVELNYSEYDVELKYSPNNVVNFLEATVYPKFAQNKNIIWSIEEQRSTTPGVYTSYQVENDEIGLGASVETNEVATIDDVSGDITLLGIYGNFYVKATTEDGNKTAACYVNVYGDKVTSIKISTLKSTLEIGEKVALNKIFTPADPSNRRVSWTSSDPNIASIDNNGIVTAISSGITNVTVTSDDGGFSDTITISVNNGPFKLCDKVYVSTNEIEISSLLNSGAVISGATNATIDSENNKIILTSDVATLLVDGRQLILVKVSSDDSIISNKEVLLKNLNGVLKNGDVVYLFAKYRDSFNNGVPNVTFKSSNDDVATISLNGGEIIVKKDSSSPVTFSILRDDIVLDSITFDKIVTPIVSLTLELNATNSAKGIAAETVFGTKNIDNTAYEIAINIKRPKSVDVDNLNFMLSDNSIGSFNGNVLRFNDTAFNGKKTFSINVSAKYPMYSDYPVVASYKMTIIDGVNVNTAEEYYNAILNKKVIALQDDIELPLSVPTNEVFASLYGNGHMICYDQDALKASENAEHGGDNEDIIVLRNSNVTLENVTLRHGAYIESKDLAQWSKVRRCLFVSEYFNENGHDDEYFENINIRYCIFENASTLVEVDGAYAKFDGCIFRNCSTCELYIPMTARADYGRLPTEVTVKNCVFTNCLTVPIMLQTEIQGDVGLYQKTATIQDAENDGYIWRYLKLEGFVDVYNWFEIDNFKVVSFSTGNPTIDKFLDGINNVIANELQLPENDNLRHKFTETDPVTGQSVEKTYYHLAIAVDGLVTPIPDYLVIGYEDAGFFMHATYITSLRNSLTPFPFYIYGYEDGKYSIGPNSSVEKDFSESADLYKNLREGRNK